MVLTNRKPLERKKFENYMFCGFSFCCCTLTANITKYSFLNLWYVHILHIPAVVWMPLLWSIMYKICWHYLPLRFGTFPGWCDGSRSSEKTITCPILTQNFRGWIRSYSSPECIGSCPPWFFNLQKHAMDFLEGLVCVLSFLVTVVLLIMSIGSANTLAILFHS